MLLAKVALKSALEPALDGIAWFGVLLEWHGEAAWFSGVFRWGWIEPVFAKWVYNLTAALHL